MFTRQTYFNVQQSKISDVKSIYEKQIMPELQAQKGLVEAHLLEPTNKTEQFISQTIWQSKSDADKYHQSGKYQELVGKLKEGITGATTLKEFEMVK